MGYNKYKPCPMVVIRYDGKCIHLPSVRAVGEFFGKAKSVIRYAREKRNGYIMQNYRIMRYDEWSPYADYHFKPKPPRKKKSRNSMPRTEEYRKILSERAYRVKPWTHMKKHPCICLDTGERFESRQAAAGRYGLDLHNLSVAIKRHCRCKGYKFIDAIE